MWPFLEANSRNFVYFAVQAFLIGLVSTTILGDECDWTGSGLTTPPLSKGVTPVYLRCAAGKIKWLYPRGALRVLLRLPSLDRNFRACLKMHSVGQKSTARVFLEGPRSLIPLFAGDDAAAQNGAIRCFNSKNGQAAIYIEATEEQTYKRHLAEIKYDLQQFPKNFRGYDHIQSECRPCTTSELAHIFCTSDLVTRGIIRGVENRGDPATSQLQVKITGLIRHTVGDEYFEDLDANAIPNLNLQGKTVTLHAPRHCDVSHGLGEFVFMARRKLGDLSLQCAPRLEDWAVLVGELNERGEAHCVLKS